MTNRTPKRIAVGSRWRGFSNPHRVLCALLASLQILLPSLVAALPSDGNVVGGHADIQQVDSKHLNIQQVTDKAILNWKSFSIAADEGVRFVQPSVTSIALNRVVGTDPSVILGHLQSNGRIFLINPNGILFGAGAQIDVGGLLATTLQIRNDDFMAGRYLFAQDPLKGMHSVINRGTIQVSDHGYVFLVAPGVSNEGVIIANLGKVLLGSGQKLTVDLMGDGLIKYALSGKVLDQVMSADGKPLSSAVSNSGTIQADGGHVVLQAKAAGDIFSSVLNQSGVIRARSLVNQEGIVRLDGGDSGLVQVAGTITASGLSTGQKGGQVSVIGESVALREMAKIDVSGDVGGGTALIGGNYQGLGPEPNAASTFVAAGASIASDAVTNGDGGKVIVWADGHTDFAGSISAKGGQLGGNGGFVEVSGKNTLGFAGQVNTSAPLGRTGILLLDPTNITISTGANANIVGLPTGPVFTGAALTSTLNVATLQNALAVNNVTVDTASAFGSAGNITVSNAVTWASANSLTLQANNNINVNAGITATGAGAIRLFAGGSVNSAAAGVLTTASGGVTIQSVGVSTLAGNVALGSGTLSVSNAGAMTISSIVSGTGGLTKTGAGTLTLSGNNTYIGVTNINVGILTLGAANRIANTNDVTVAGGATFNLNNFAETIGSLSGAGNVTLGTGTMTTGGNNGTTTYSGIMSGTGGLAKAGTGVFTLSGANTYTGATTINAGTLQLGAAERIANTSAVTVAGGATFNLNNFAETIGSLSGAGNVTLGSGTLIAGGNNTSTTYSGIMSGTGGLTKAGTGVFTLSGANTYTGTTTINAGMLRVAGGAAIADTSDVTLANVAGATLDLNGTNETIGSLAGGGALGGNVALGTGVLTTGGNNGTTAYTGIISGTGGLTKAGTGVFTLSGANTYTGATTINAGTVTLGAANRIADVSAVTVTGGTTFNLNGFAETIGSLIGAGNVTLGAGTLTTGDAANTTFSGIMSGTGGLTKQGIGVFTLSGNNTYSGVTNVNAGTLVATANNALGTTAGGTTVASGATLGFSGGINYSTAEPVTVNGGTLANIAGNNIFAGPITLTANSSITVADGTALTVGGTINGGSQLNISSGTGSINFLSAIGGTTPLSSLTANVGSISSGPVTTTGTQTYTGPTTLNGNLTTTNSAITFNSPVTLGANTILDTSAGDIAFGNTLNGAFSLNANNTGTTTFGGIVGGATALTSLTTNAGGTTAINGGSITTSGNQTYSDDVTMNQATTLTSSGGAVTFGGNATNTLAGAALTIDAPTINLTGGTTIATIGNGNINFFTDTLNPNGASINVGTGSFALAPNVLTRTIEFGDVNTGLPTDVYYGSNFGSVTAGSFTIGRLAQTGDIFVTGVAAAPASINMVNGGTGSITFQTNPYVSGGRNLGVLAGSGGINLSSDLTLGAGTLRLTTTGAITQTAGAITANTVGLSAATDITLAQPANNVTTLAAQTTTGNISFADTNDFTIGSVSATADGFHPAITGLTASAGIITLQSGGAVTQTQRILASALSLQGSGPYQLTDAGNNVTTLAANTTGNLQYTDVDALTVGTVGALNGITAAGDVALTTLGGGALTVLNGITTTNNGTVTLTNAGSLALNADVAADGAVLQNGAGAVTTGGAGTRSITTTGDNVTINQALTLASDLLVDTNSAVSGNVTFNSTINGGQNLVINTGGATTFGGVVGGTTALTSLTTNAVGTTAINGGAITTTSNQTYNDAVTLGANTILNAGAGALTFGNTLNGAFSLTANSTGSTIFGGLVGNTTALTSLTTNVGGTTAINGGGCHHDRSPDVQRYGHAWG